MSSSLGCIAGLSEAKADAMVLVSTSTGTDAWYNEKFERLRADLS